MKAKGVALGVLVFLLGACARLAGEDTVGAVTPTPDVRATLMGIVPVAAATGPAEEVEGPASPTATPVFLPGRIDPSKVAFDFLARMCEATWSTSGEYLPCPGDPGQLDQGFVGRVQGPLVIGGYETNLDGILTVQPKGGDFGGVFGAYPPVQVLPGDEFRAFLACHPDQPACDVEFALEYFDPAGQVRDLGPQARWRVTAADGPRWVVVPLEPLAGQSVRFLLSVRPEGDPTGDHALWLGPYLYGMPDRPSPPPPAPTQAPPPEGAQWGTIAGSVDMSTAPPFLRDPVVHPYGMPVAVVFFNLDDNTWWWVHNTATFPNFEMTVPPGRYHVVAYARGVGDIPYVSGGYTGENPSCGQPLKEVVVPPGGWVGDVVIADWGTDCGVDHRQDYPAKPDSVPLP